MKYPEARGSQTFSLALLSSQPAAHRLLNCQLQVFKYINQLSSWVIHRIHVDQERIKLQYQCNTLTFSLLTCSYHVGHTLFLCVSLFLNIILLLTMIKKQKQICNGVMCWLLVVPGVSDDDKEKTHMKAVLQITSTSSAVWEDEGIFWFLQVFKHLCHFFPFVILDTASLCL